MIEDLSWKEKYLQVKARYNQLVNLRVSAVEEDINDLKKKIEEHINAHMATIKEIKEENLSLIEEIHSINSKKEKIDQLKQRIEYHKSKLRVIDTILNNVLQYRFLAVKCVGPNHYRIQCINNDNIVFELFKGPKTTQYRPIRIPNSQLFSRFRQELQVPDLKIFCNELQKVVNQY